MTVVLVVDDCPDVLEILGAMLEGAGYTAILTQEPGRAVRMSQEVDFDVALCDLYLPRGERDAVRSAAVGIDLMSLLRRSRPGLPVIAMSGNPESINREDKKLADFCAILCKPFDRAKLVKEIERALKRTASSATAPVPES